MDGDFSLWFGFVYMFAVLDFAQIVCYNIIKYVIVQSRARNGKFEYRKTP